MADQSGEADIRSEVWKKTVEGFALQNYVLKNLCSITTTDAWSNSYFEETAADLTAAGTRDVGDVSRLSKFPNVDVSWTEKTKRLGKFGAETTISWEDANTNRVDVIARSLLRLARAVTFAVDKNIYAGIKANVGQTLAITALSEWDAVAEANRDPIQNILDAKKLIDIQNYDPDQNGFLVLSPKDHALLVGNANVRNAGQFYSAEPTKKGMVGNLLNLTVIKTNSVTEADKKAFVIIAKEAMTWLQNKPLKVVTIEDPMVKFTIRAGETGALQVINPNAMCELTGTHV